MGDAPIEVQRYRKKLAEGHLEISATLEVEIQNSTDLERGAAPELKSVEFVFYAKRVGEIFDVHADFTAGQMLHLYRSIPRMTHSLSSTLKKHQTPLAHLVCVMRVNWEQTS